MFYDQVLQGNAGPEMLNSLHLLRCRKESIPTYQESCWKMDFEVPFLRQADHVGKYCVRNGIEDYEDDGKEVPLVINHSERRPVMFLSRTGDPLPSTPPATDFCTTASFHLEEIEEEIYFSYSVVLFRLVDPI